MRRFSIHLNSSRCKNILSTCLLIVSWLYANARSLQWLYQALLQASSFNLILMGAAGIFLLWRFLLHQHWREWLKHPRLVFPTLRLTLIPLLLMLVSALLAIATTWFINIEQLSVLLFILGSYGLLGLFIDSSVWRKNLPIAALIGCILPFAAQYSTGLGMPVRVMTARTVEQLLSTLNISAISSHEIILLENGIAHVDLPCSGLKSLWTGSVFLLAVTWLENRILGIKWLLVCVASLVLLVSTNTLRVLILVVANYVLKQPQLAQVLHLPLGIIGFICACSLTWLMLQMVPNQKIQNTEKSQPEKYINLVLVDKLYLPKYLIVTTVAIAFLLAPQFYDRNTPSLAIASVRFPPEIVSESIPLTAVETKFFKDQSTPTIAEKWRFNFEGISGSLLLVFTTSWQSHHAPELCLTGSGLNVDWMQTKQLTKNVIGRWLSLENKQLSAMYWLQSPQGTTDDFLLRLWSQITHKNQTWALVSILLDNTFTADNPQIHDLATNIHNVVNISLKGEQQ